MTNQAIESWLESGEHLPTILRDFHDQKNLFKAMHYVMNCDNVPVGWMKGHVYVIDYFLWFMARRGYTLQRSRKNLGFSDIKDDIERFKANEAKAFSSMLNIKGDHDV